MRLFKTLSLGLCFFGVVAQAAGTARTFALATSSNTQLYAGQQLTINTNTMDSRYTYDVTCVFYTNSDPRYPVNMHVEYDYLSPSTYAALNGRTMPNDDCVMKTGVNEVEFFNVNSRNGNLYVVNDGAAAGDDTITLMGKCMASYN